ncbi:hypothetical protein PVAP13_6NG048530 [Panicum virgatum]|uniref:Uncharacterized protein n=1 Tax=Panicum virgatum TaxID=38727 RepID=A0A8T0QVM6_PANVG|nr:hypothetical protein PVAP13_6NG048530 [Panicum virgatum]
MGGALSRAESGNREEAKRAATANGPLTVSPSPTSMSEGCDMKKALQGCLVKKHTDRQLPFSQVQLVYNVVLSLHSNCRSMIRLDLPPYMVRLLCQGSWCRCRQEWRLGGGSSSGGTGARQRRAAVDAKLLPWIFF